MQPSQCCRTVVDVAAATRPHLFAVVEHVHLLHSQQASSGVTLLVTLLLFTTQNRQPLPKLAPEVEEDL
jgi:hypothetical protein